MSQFRIVMVIKATVSFPVPAQTCCGAAAELGGGSKREVVVNFCARRWLAQPPI